MNTDLFTKPVEAPIYTVTSLSQSIKKVVEINFSRVRLRGEISGLKKHTSGHVYFTLKDETSVIDAVCWRGVANSLQVALADGLEIICTGRITTYPGRSKYQVVLEQAEVAGEGALLKLLEDRKKKLAAEGLFALERKKPIPFLPTLIGVVTSPTGAVIKDILHRLEDRFPRDVLLWPVLVQGEGAAEQITAAVKGFNALENKPDLLIVARGGGSLEDLWPFNEENVARAVAESEIPVISAVGHETDVTLVDFVSDKRAPTPTAAAEMAVPVRLELLARTNELSTRLLNAKKRNIIEAGTRLERLVKSLKSPVQLLEESTQRLDEWYERLNQTLKVNLQEKLTQVRYAEARLVHPKNQITFLQEKVTSVSHRLQKASQVFFQQKTQSFETSKKLLESYSYTRVLERGFSLVQDENNQVVSSYSDTKPSQNLTIKWHDGEREVVTK